VAKVGTSNPDRTISLKKLKCVVENKKKTELSTFSAICTLFYIILSPIEMKTHLHKSQEGE